MQGKRTGQGNLFVTPLHNLLNPWQPLYRLADEIDWQTFEEAFGGLDRKACFSGPTKLKKIRFRMENFKISSKKGVPQVFSSS